MKKRSNNIVIGSMIAITTSIGILFFLSEKSSQEHISNWLATSPAHSLYRAQNALNHNHLNQAEEDLDKAILELQSIEMYSDVIVNKYIERAVEDLQIIEGELMEDKLNLEDLNVVFFEALIAVAYADLRIAEEDLKNQNGYKAIYLLRSSLLILKRSLLYTNDSIKNKENIIIKQLNGVLDSLKQSPDFHFYDFTEINTQIEEILNDSQLN